MILHEKGFEEIIYIVSTFNVEQNIVQSEMKRVMSFAKFVTENFELPGWSSEEPKIANQREPQTQFGDDKNFISDDDELYYYWLSNLDDGDYEDDGDYHYDDED